MIVSLDSIKLGVCSYIEKEIVCKMQGLGKWIMAFGISGVPKMVDEKIDMFKPWLADMGVLSDDNHLNIDSLETSFADIADKYGKVTQTIMSIPITFTTEDIHTLVKHIKAF